jgi:hypothetical protein
MKNQLFKHVSAFLKFDIVLACPNPSMPASRRYGRYGAGYWHMSGSV